MLALKLQKHGEAVEDIFRNYLDGPESESNAGDGPFNVSLAHIPKILKDLAYLTGLTLSTY
jgi:hypothetical protein